MMFETLVAINNCGVIGPTILSTLVALAPSEAYTLQPYANTAAITRIGPPQPLNIDDLAGCSFASYFTMSDLFAMTEVPSSMASLKAAYTSYWAEEDNSILLERPLSGSWYRCNPRFVMPTVFDEGPE